MCGLVTSRGTTSISIHRTVADRLDWKAGRRAKRKLFVIEHRARNRFVGSEKQNGVGNISGQQHAAEGARFHRGFHPVLTLTLDHRDDVALTFGQGPAGVDLVHTNPVLRQVTRQIFGKGHQRALGGGIGQQPLQPAVGVPRTDVDDAAALPVFHVAHSFLAKKEGGAHVDLEDFIPQRGGGVLNGAAMHHPGVVHEDINPPEARERVADDAAAVRLIPQIARHQRRLASGGLDGLDDLLPAGSLAVAPVHENSRARLGEFKRDSPTNALCRACDYRHLARQRSLFGICLAHEFLSRCIRSPVLPRRFQDGVHNFTRGHQAAPLRVKIVLTGPAIMAFAGNQDVEFR